MKPLWTDPAAQVSPSVIRSRYKLGKKNILMFNLYFSFLPSEVNKSP